MIYAGQSVKPFESRRFVTGSGSFVADLTFPDMLHVVVLRSLHAHAKLKAIQVAAACARPGVMAVLTAADLSGVLNHIPPPIMGPGRPVETMHTPLHPLLATDTVCYVGQPIALVVAQDLAAVPHLDRRVVAAQEQHGPLGDVIRQIVEDAGYAGLSADAWRHVADAFEAFAEELLVHEREENAIASDAYLEDLGAGN